MKSRLKDIIMSTDKVSIFKSQKGQDAWVIEEVLPLQKNGFFLDVGAGDGIIHSNTYALEKLFGWNGICIEPNPMFLQSLQMTRNCAICNSVISDKREKVKFRTDNGCLGGIVAEDTDNSVRIRGNQLLGAEINVFNALPLTEVLDRYNAPSVIDYLSLDVEGAEERVMMGLDLEKYRFKCMTIERPNPNVNKILVDAGYVFVKNHRFDAFYVHPLLIASITAIKTYPFEQIPRKDW